MIDAPRIPNEPEDPTPFEAGYGSQVIAAPATSTPRGFKTAISDPETEGAVLGALMLTNALHDHIPYLEARDFYSPKHSAIFAAIVRLHSTSRTIDTLTVADELRVQGDTVNGGELVSITASTPAATNLPAYIEVLKRHTHRRRVLHLARQLTEAAELNNLDAAAGLIDTFEAVPSTRTAIADQIAAKILTGDEIDNLPDPEWLIRDYLVRDSLATLYGRPGSYKSFVALSWALAIATGTPFFGRPLKPQTVLYCVAEGAAGMKRRRTAWMRHNDVGGSTERLHWLPMAVPLLDPLTIGAVAQVAGELEPSLIVIDTLSRSLVGGDENSSRDMPMAIAALDELREATAACVLTVHHSGKDSEKGARGHTALLGAMDTEIECKAAEQIVTLRISKQKDHADGDNFRFKMTEHSGSVVLDMYTGSAETENALKILPVLEALDEGHGVTSGALEDAVLEDLNYSRATYMRVRKYAVERNWIEQIEPEKSRSPYRLTALGKSALKPAQAELEEF